MHMQKIIFFQMANTNVPYALVVVVHQGHMLVCMPQGTHRVPSLQSAVQEATLYLAEPGLCYYHPISIWQAAAYCWVGLHFHGRFLCIGSTGSRCRCSAAWAVTLTTGHQVLPQHSTAHHKLSTEQLCFVLRLSIHDCNVLS